MRFQKLLPQNSKRREVVKKFYEKYITKYSEEERRYMKWIKNNEPTDKELDEQRKYEFKIQPKISILVPVYNTPQNFFEELVQSLQNQTYSNWELCLADGSPEPINYMKEYPKKDKRIKYKIIGENKGISGNTNEALDLATGDYIGLLDHDDLLPAFSLFEIVKTINENPEVEFIYSDEDKLEDINKPRYGVFFKPDFSPYTLNSANYICHFSVFKKELMDKLGGFRSEYDGSQDFDIVARASELTNNIVHVPKVLYHWRAHRNSTASNSDSKPYAFEVGKKVIKDHVKRLLDTDVIVEDGLTPGSYELFYQLKENPKVSIIIDARKTSRERLENVLNELKKATYKNLEMILIVDEKNKEELKVFNNTIKKQVISKQNKFEAFNEAVKKAEGKYFIIIDRRLRKIDKENFIEQLLGIAQDNSVGIVGTKLYNKNNNVEHSGIILGMNGAGDFLYRGAPKDCGTYMQRLIIIHNLTCVYTKYALINKEIFEKVGGFATEYIGTLASIDVSLKIREENKQVVINPIVSFCVDKLSDAVQLKEQIDDFKNKWKKYYDKGDIYFSPNLSKKNTGLVINIDE